jgi:hypothetical protein
MYSVYGDESHDEDSSRIFAVAGVFGNDQEWVGLKTAWSARTVGRVFHAADCDSDQGDFAKTSHEENKRLYADLTNILAKSNLLGYGAALSLADYGAVFPTPFENIPYYLCFALVVKNMADTARLCVPPDKVEFRFDHHEPIQHNASAVYDYLVNLPEGRNIAATVSFSNRTNVGIQVADLCARETMKHFDNQDGPVKRPTRKSFRALKDTHRFRFELYEKEALSGLRRAVEGLSGGHFREWLARFKLPDTLETRIRYRVYLDVTG